MSASMMNLSEVAELVGGRVRGDTSIEVKDVRDPMRAGPGDFALVSETSYVADLANSKAAAVLVTEDLVDQIPSDRSSVVVSDVQPALVTLLERFHPVRKPAAGVHATAVLGSGVVLGEGVHVGPYAVIGDDTEIADGCVIGAHVVVGAGCTLGEDSVLHPHTVVYPDTDIGRDVILHAGVRVGVDGFGYVPTPEGPRRIPHRGPCLIGDEVEIGANSCVDRGSLDGTRIGRAVKLDNLVHIAHNVEVGEGTLMAALVGIAGSCSIGPATQWGGQSGSIPHRKVGKGARISGKCGVTSDVEAGETMMSFPSKPRREHMKALANLYRLDQLKRRVRELESRLGEGDG
jgi:UDP-3-O-[3-hydroxymyristoyl] glucosamine N-acyltransferase